MRNLAHLAASLVLLAFAALFMDAVHVLEGQFGAFATQAVFAAILAVSCMVGALASLVAVR